MESQASCAGARRHLAAVKAAMPEVLTAIKTKQLAQELLLYKEDHLEDIQMRTCQDRCAGGHARRGLGFYTL